MKRLTLICAVAAVVGVWPAVSSAATTTSTGVVVAKQRGALLVASPAGAVTAVAGSASIGSRVAVSGGHATVVGRSRTAHLRGIVVRRVGKTMFIASNRHLLAVHDTTPAPASPTTTTPQPGAVVSSQVIIENGRLEDENDDVVGQANANELQVQAVVSAVGMGTVTLTVGTQTLTVSLPAGLTLPASIVGQTVTLTVSLGDDDNAGDDDNGGGGGGGDSRGHGHGGGDGGNDD
jgi:hypothetical protein